MEPGERGVGGAAAGADAGVDDDAVDRAEPRFGGVVGGDHRGLLRDVERDGVGAIADFGGERGGQFEAARAEHDARAFADAEPGKAGTDARRGTGDQHRSTGELPHRPDRPRLRIHLRCRVFHSGSLGSIAMYLSTDLLKWRTRISW